MVKLCELSDVSKRCEDQLWAPKMPEQMVAILSHFSIPLKRVHVPVPGMWLGYVGKLEENAIDSVVFCSERDLEGAFAYQNLYCLLRIEALSNFVSILECAQSARWTMLKRQKEAMRSIW